MMNSKPPLGPLPFSKSRIPPAPSSPGDEGFLSKSLGDAYRSSGGILPPHRQISEVSSIIHSGYLFKRSNRPFQQAGPFPVDSLEIDAKDVRKDDGEEGLRYSLQPKPTTLDDVYGFGGRYYNPFPHSASNANEDGTSHHHGNGNGKYYQQRRPLHLSITDPNTSLAAKFGGLYNSNYPAGVPMAPFLKSSDGTMESISTKASELEESPIASLQGEEEEEEGKGEGEGSKRQLAIEQSLNSAAAFFGVNVEHTFNLPPSVVTSSSSRQEKAVTPSPDANMTSPSIFRETPEQKDTTVSLSSPPTQQQQQPQLTPPPTKSMPIKMHSRQQQQQQQSQRDSFDPTAFHRHVSAPSVFDTNSTAADDGGTMYSNRSRPSDYVDNRDGHLWRAKYCVLEDGILYFYRNADDANSPEAQQERKNSDPLAADTTSPTKKSGGTTGKFDLSKSPMASKSLINLSSVDGSLSGSNSDVESSFMWEKRVALNCVGAVRSAETEYGSNAFELLAVEDEEGDEHTDKLVLKAVTLEEMNEWLFQFHRSLASFVMNMVDLVGSSPNYAVGDIHHPSFSHQGTNQTIQHSPVQSFNILAFSPRFVRGMQGPPAASLSHGHGRNLPRRRKNDLKKSYSNDSVASSPSSWGSQVQIPFSLSQVTTPPIMSNLVTPLKHGESSPLAPELQIPKGGASEVEEISPELSAPQSANPPETERPPAPATGGKYIPPHMRKGSAKYVPPHLRNKGAVNNDEVKPQAQKYVPPYLRNRDNVENGSRFEDGTLPPRPLSLAERESMTPVPLTKSVAEVSSGTMSQSIPKIKEPLLTSTFKLGGCADPLVIAGSILDQMYIPKSASKVDRAQTYVFGSFGGSKDSSSSKNSDSDVNIKPSSSLQWEIGAVSECGVRDANEDAYFVTNDLSETFANITAGEVAPTYWDCVNNDNNHQTGLFAIFDGHCGNQAARFAAERLPYFLYRESLNYSGDRKCEPEGMEEIMRRAIIKMDEAFCRICVEDEREWESGSTALVAMLANEHLVIANVGDCRGVLCRVTEDRGLQRPSFLQRQGWNELVGDNEDIHYGERCFWKEVAEVHNPSRKDEKFRIEEAGGWTTTEKEIPISQLQRMDFLDEDVIGILKRCFMDRIHSSQSGKACNSSSAPQRILQISRVCGELAVSRAIGDRDFKAHCNQPSADGVEGAWDCPLLLPYPADHSRQFVGDLISGKPDFHSIRVGDADVEGEFLLLACDGLWDVMDMDDAVRVTRDLLFARKCPAKQAAARLAELAIHLGSSDNITVIVIRFYPKKPNESLPRLNHNNKNNNVFE